MKERIGRGSFGDVYRATYRHAEVAVKKLPDLNEMLIVELIREAKLMLSALSLFILICRTLRHPNVVQFMGVCTTKPDICLVTEFISRGSLYKILHSPNIDLAPEHLRRLALDTCKGMAYLHAARIIHRDLKTHNLLVDKNWTVKGLLPLSFPHSDSRRFRFVSRNRSNCLHHDGLWHAVLDCPGNLEESALHIQSRCLQVTILSSLYSTLLIIALFFIYSLLLSIVLHLPLYFH